MKNKSLLIVFLLLTSCLSKPKEISFFDQRRMIIHKAVKEFNQMMNEKGFRAAGIGEGIDRTTGKQNYLKVVLETDYLPNVEFARQIEINALRDFLNIINSQENIEQYLVEYPFTIKYVEIAFINRHSENGLCHVFNIRNKIYYNVADHSKPMAPSIELYEETFEEAEVKLRGSS